MKPRCVHQLLAGSADGDAISREARVIRDILRRQGIQSDIVTAVSEFNAAELFQRVLTDAGLRQEILNSQKKRMEDFRRRDLAADCLKLLPPP